VDIRITAGTSEGKPTPSPRWKAAVLSVVKGYAKDTIGV
jgi:hypothetical protein